MALVPQNCRSTTGPAPSSGGLKEGQVLACGPGRRNGYKGVVSGRSSAVERTPKADICQSVAPLPP